jgi:hypothetical protein
MIQSKNILSETSEFPSCRKVFVKKIEAKLVLFKSPANNYNNCQRTTRNYQTITY